MQIPQDNPSEQAQKKQRSKSLSTVAKILEADGIAEHKLEHLHTATQRSWHKMWWPLPQKGLDIAIKNTHGILGTKTPQMQFKLKPHILSAK